MPWPWERARRRRTDDARVHNRERYRRATDAVIVDESIELRDYHVACSLGGFGVIGIPWGGTSLENARDAFLEYITNHDEFRDVDDRRFEHYRSLYVNFHGQYRLLTFRTDWVAGFTVH